MCKDPRNKGSNESSKHAPVAPVVLLAGMTALLLLVAQVTMSGVALRNQNLLRTDVANIPGESGIEEEEPVLALSRLRNQQFDDAECWDLVWQRWTQIVSEEDTGGMVTVMQVDMPNGCAQIAHVHCGLHEAFYKLDDNGHAVWTSVFEGSWQEVSPSKGDFSYAAMGTGHGYTNAGVASCSGDDNIRDYTETSFTSHFVIKMPGFEHETRARTVPTGNAGAAETCDLMKNRIETGYSQAAKDNSRLYDLTDPKFIAGLVSLEEGKTYTPSKDSVKPIQYTPSTDTSVILPDWTHLQYGNARTVRRLMSLDSWNDSDIGTGGVAQMDQVKFSGDAASLSKSPAGTDLVILLVEGEATFRTKSGYEMKVPERSGFVIKAQNTDDYGLDCADGNSMNGCTLLELRIGGEFAESFMHDNAYGVPWETKITDVTADYVTGPGPGKNTYQRCITPNDPAMAPDYVDYTEANKPTGAQDRKVPFSCFMTCVAENGFGNNARALCEEKYQKQTYVKTSTACPELLNSTFN